MLAGKRVNKLFAIFLESRCVISTKITAFFPLIKNALNRFQVNLKELSFV